MAINLYTRQLILFITSLLLSVSSLAENIQDLDTSEISTRYKRLKLKETLEQGLRQNHDQHLRQYDGELLDLTWRDQYSEYWFPEVNLVFNSEKLVSRLKSNSDNQLRRSKNASGSVGLEFGEYTLFNWGKDYLKYLNNKNLYNRNRDVLNEKRRELKLDLVYNFFNLVKHKANVIINKDYLRHTSFIYRLNKERYSLNKISRVEYLNSKSEYLQAQNDYNEAKISKELADENMTYMINDHADTRYLIKQDLKFKKLTISLNEALRISRQRNPDLLTSRVDIENADRSYQISKKDDLPLPKFTVNLGAYKHTFGQNYNTTRYENSYGQDVELVASINATWAISGKNGFFNSRKRHRSFVNKKYSIKKYHQKKHIVGIGTREAYKKIKYIEAQLSLVKAKIRSSESSFDKTLDQYLNRKGRFSELKIVLNQLIEAKLYQNELLHEHLLNKLNLAKLIGVEDLPDDVFEHLAKY